MHSRAHLGGSAQKTTEKQLATPKNNSKVSPARPSAWGHRPDAGRGDNHRAYLGLIAPQFLCTQVSGLACLALKP